MNNKELETRITQFSVNVLHVTSSLTVSKQNADLIVQLNRCAVSATLNYAEARSAESYKDFGHKVGITLKELREALACLRILDGISNENHRKGFQPLLDECDQLVSIFVKITMKTKMKPLK
jgi:four helix bundle protein